MVVRPGYPGLLDSLSSAAAVQVLQRPENEKVYLLMPVGMPAANATVPYRDPAAAHKPMDELMLRF